MTTAFYGPLSFYLHVLSSHLRAFATNYIYNRVSWHRPHNRVLQALWTVLSVFFSALNWSLFARALRSELVRGEAERTQLRPFSPYFRNNERVTRRTLEIFLNNGVKCSAPRLIDCPNDLIMGPSITFPQCTPNRVYVFREGLTMPDHSDVSQSVAGHSWLQLAVNVPRTSRVTIPACVCTQLVTWWSSLVTHCTE